MNLDHNYTYDLLVFLLDSTGRDYEIIQSDEVTTQSRNVMNLKNNQRINFSKLRRSITVDPEITVIAS
ncbi:MAG: hypothetical protein JXR86_20510 [Spirochaetales bacterium]|nr:hypothetical protein [Spirochaetales bacterium]